MNGDSRRKDVVIVGGGFAGLGCARGLAKSDAVRITLLDKNNFHQFQPLLYQLATAQLGTSDVATSLRQCLHGCSSVDVKEVEVTAVNPNTRAVVTKTGESYQGDFLVLAAGSQANFFGTPGAEKNAFPLYSLNEAQRLRSRVLGVFEDADSDPSLIEKGALTFVIIGAGPTGTEMAGSLADMIDNTMTSEYSDLAVKAARIYVIDHGHSLLGAFSPEAQQYAARTLERKGVQLRLGALVKEVAPGHVLLSDGTSILTRTAVWAGGLMAAPLSARAGLPLGRGGRIEVRPDFTIEGFPGVYALGDFANAPSPDGRPFPQLGSVALQSGEYVAASILDEIAGRPRTPFQYHDRGIMAMIGRNAAVAEIGSKRHELDGPIAFAAWLGVHAMLMSTIRERVEAFITWAWNYFGRSRAVQVLDRSDEGRIDWKADPESENVSVPPAVKAAG